MDRTTKQGQGKRRQGNRGTGTGNRGWRQGKRRQNNRGTGTGNREWRQVKRDRINGDRITEEQR